MMHICNTMHLRLLLFMIFSMRPFLSDEELERVLNEWIDSEDEFDNESDDEMLGNEDLVIATKCGEGTHTDYLNNAASSMDVEDIFGILPGILGKEQLPSPSFVVRDFKKEIFELKEKYKKVLWKQNHSSFDSEQSKFIGDGSLSEELLGLSTPLSFFNYFFSDDIVNHIVSESHLYATEINPNRSASISADHIKKYMGICILMSVVQVPNIRRYWSPIVGNETIANTMTVNEFEKIRRYLHFNTNSSMLPKDHPQHDRLHKIRPLLTHLFNKFSTIPREECLSLDEQICATKARSYMKQYMPAKPHKWGYKLWVLSGVSGFIYNFEIYAGREMNDQILSDEPNLGACANVVVRLTRCVEKNVGHKIYFDNFYTTLPLVVELAKKGIYSVGTIRRNRLPNCKLPTETELKKEARGKCVEFFTTIDKINICSVCWKDKKTVNLLSKFVSAHPISTVKRYDKTKLQHIDIDCPNIIKQYNMHMGGVDLTDSLIGRYRIKIKSRKWYMRIFYHLIDITVVNSWLLYKKISSVRKEIPMSLCDFRIDIAESLCRSGVVLLRPRGRPVSSPVQSEQGQRKRKCLSSHTPDDVKKDGISHWPVFMEKRLRCKLPGCSGYAFIKCDKCNCALCLNKHNNCLRTFHS